MKVNSQNIKFIQEFSQSFFLRCLPLTTTHSYWFLLNNYIFKWLQYSLHKSFYKYYENKKV